MKEPKKILAIIFKYLGDVAVAVPSLRAIKEFYPNCELHVLVAEEAAPLLDQIPWVNRVWGISRIRGQAKPTKTWPVIRALKAEKFDRSVDFVGNDRGAILSLLVGARHRLGPIVKRGFFGRRYCYNQTIPEGPIEQHEILRDLHILSAWKIPQPRSLDLETCANPKWKTFAEPLISSDFILCHITTSQPKKEWPLESWIEFSKLAAREKLKLIFAAGPSPREQNQLAKLFKLENSIKTLPAISDLGAYLAVLERAHLFVSADTGPLHFAAGLGVPTISLFGPSSDVQWAPMGLRHWSMRANGCQCCGQTSVCVTHPSCLKGIKPEIILEKAKALLETAAW